MKNKQPFQEGQKVRLICQVYGWHPTAFVRMCFHPPGCPESWYVALQSENNWTGNDCWPVSKLEPHED